MEIPMLSFRSAKPCNRLLHALLAAALAAPVLLLSGCMMTPEDKAFYGRGWINPDELDQEQPPPRAFTDPTAIPDHMMGPGDY
jgi:hypothetical protein